MNSTRTAGNPLLVPAEAFVDYGDRRVALTLSGGIDSRTLLKDFFELLSPHGFQLHKLYPTSLKHISRYDQALENFQYQNWVAIQQA